MAIECLVLGAGQEVGKSCVVVSIGGKRIMFDCGMHMGYLDHRRYPDFSRISESGDFDSAITCIIITHFHLDHIGALPYFTEVCGYRGPIYMTYPTKALAPLMLEDYRKVMVDRRGEKELFSSDDIIECMKKVIAVDLKQTIYVDRDLQIRPYYAGHVIGAAMFYAKVGDSTMVYTGDYNMTPDRHLGAAQIDRLQLDLLITESTYATTIRDSKYAREREFLKAETLSHPRKTRDLQTLTPSPICKPWSPVSPTSSQRCLHMLSLTPLLSETKPSLLNYHLSMKPSTCEVLVGFSVISRDCARQHRLLRRKGRRDEGK
ncbi:hypothetical protein MRB53_008534 [Persea americana]|uniref:Uncharacterized protein n=1 Tax=Persea americana TaxID=3435 RepID=A0ACC2MMB7_PERAE|nr:hypothetical protein MRB53_008534 [Persea americana]